jgi:hypothetical protein
MAEKISIKHKVCGQIFEIRPSDHIRPGAGCNICRLEKLGNKRRKVEITNLIDNKITTFRSMKDAQKFFTKETNDNLIKGIQSSYQCKGAIFQYRGFNVQIFNSEYKKE